jgi:hypothetical protein
VFCRYTINATVKESVFLNTTTSNYLKIRTINSMPNIPSCATLKILSKSCNIQVMDKTSLTFIIKNIIDFSMIYKRFHVMLMVNKLIQTNLT